MVRFPRTIYVPEIVTVGDVVYAFVGWSDGDAGEHVVAPGSKQDVLTAEYSAREKKIPHLRASGGLEHFTATRTPWRSKP